MARQPNMFYRDPTAEIGSNLLTAMFGDPQAAAKQRQMQSEQEQREAQAEADRARAQLLRGQAAGVEASNTANTGLPDLFANLYKTVPAVAPRAPMGNESDDAGEIPGTPGVTSDQAFKAGLPALFAALAQGGHGAQVGNFTQAAAAFGGGDELARRGLVSDGHTPGKDFALTPQRADEIAATDASAKLLQALGVARVNHATDIPVAKIKAGADIGVATINNRDDVPVARIAAEGRVDAAGARGKGTVALAGNNPGGINDGDFARSQPGYVGSNGRYAGFDTLAHGEAAQKELVRRYIARGYDTPAKIAERWAPRADGNDPVAYAATIARTLGIGVNDKLTPADVDRFQQAQGGAENGRYRASAWAKAPRAISPASMTMLKTEIETQIALYGGATEAALAEIRSRSAELYQRTGNPVASVTQAIKDRIAAGHARNQRLAQPATQKAAPKPSAAAAKPKGNPAYPDAKRAPDGNLYVIISPAGAPVKYGMVPG